MTSESSKKRIRRFTDNNAYKQRIGSNRTGPSRTGPKGFGVDRTGPSRTGPEGFGSNRTGPNRTGLKGFAPNRTGPDRTRLTELVRYVISLVGFVTFRLCYKFFLGDHF